MALFSTHITCFAYSTLPVNPSGIARFVGRGLPNLITCPFRPNATIRAAVHSPLVKSLVEYKSEDDLKFEQYVAAKVKQVNHELEKAVPLRYPLRLHESMRHTLLADSERVMSILCIASCELVGGDESQAMASACAIEMMHTMSLIHDDLPCMDGGKRMGLNFERVKYWLSVGVQPSDPVQNLLFRAGVLPPPPMVAMGRKGGPRDMRLVDPLTGRIITDKPATNEAVASALEATNSN